MSETCFKCHGPGQQEAGLRLDHREQATGPAASGSTPIAPGQPDASEIIRRIFSTDDAERMPPPESNN